MISSAANFGCGWEVVLRGGTVAPKHPANHTTLATQIPEHVCERRKALCITTERPLTYRCGIPV